MLTRAKNLLRKLVHLVGYDITRYKRPVRSGPPASRHGTNLNIGCGHYVIEGFTSLDIYTDHYHAQDGVDFVEYDMRKDDLPYRDGTVDNIYASHVIEHIETEHVRKFIEESHRVLKPGGVLRIVCPDCEFFFQVSGFENGYWSWRENWFSGPHARKDIGKPSQLDCLISEVAAPRCEFYVHSIPHLVLHADDIRTLRYQEAMETLRQGLPFRKDYPGDHINAWDFDRLRELAGRAGFRHVIRSKPGGSVSAAMQGADMDRTHPQMSLYVDMVK